jgi:GT2 family glycosyltransferase
MEKEITQKTTEELQQRIDELTKENKILAENNSKLNTTLSRQSSRISALSDEVHQLRTSTSWKITKPIRAISSLWLLFIKAYYFFKRNGLKATVKRIFFRKQPVSHYVADNCDAFNLITDKQRKKEEKEVFDRDITFSIIVPLYNTPETLLKEMIDSVVNQTYAKWELCLADGSDDEHTYVGKYVNKLAKSDKRIKYEKLEKNGGISENTNACIDMSTGDYIALFDHDDLLHPSALYEYMKVICEKDADFIYCDEDKFNELGKGFFDPHFKPDFAPDNLRSNNYICHFTVFSRELYNQVGGFRKEFDGSQDHDIILRLTEKAKSIVHVPKVLYHWRVSAASVASDPYAKPYTIQAGINAVSEHLERVGLKGTVESCSFHPNFYRIRYDIIGEPLISILIPNYNNADILKTCIDSIRNKSTYKNYEIIIIENNSNEETFRYYDTLRDDPRIKVVVYHPEGGFNYSAINNFGEKYANGEYLLLLNNDVEIITEDWMEEMLMFCQRDDVGAVGAKLYYPDDTIQHAGVILGIGGVAGHSHKYFGRNELGYFSRARYQQDLSACTAACLMIRRSLFNEIGGFDETLAVAFNDIDLCMKIREKGYLIVFTPYAELYHYESKSRGTEDSPEKVARFNGEVQRFFGKWKSKLDEGDPYYNPNLTLETEDFALK